MPCAIPCATPCLVLPSLVVPLALSLGPPKVLAEAPVQTPVVIAWAGGTGDDVQERHGSCGGSTCPSPGDGLGMLPLP